MNLKLLVIVAALLVSLCFASCAKKTEPRSVETTSLPKSSPIRPTSRIFLLKLDCKTYKFKGGAQLSLSHSLVTGDSLPLIVYFTGPGDFYNTRIFYQYANNNDLLFDAGVVWMGKGTIRIPASFDSSVTYARLSESLPQPDTRRFQYIHNKIEDGNKPNVSELWTAIGRLKVVQEYLFYNKKIGMFLYTPKIGMFDSSVAEWIVFLSD